MTGTFVDTVCICTLTGLTIMTSGAYEYSQANGLEGVEVTAAAFGNGLPWAYSAGTFVLMTALAFFAFTTTTNGVPVFSLSTIHHTRLTSTTFWTTHLLPP